MKALNVKNIAALFGYTLSFDGDITEVVTDSRKAGAGSLFVAIKGEHADGNDYVDAALAKAATLVLCERSPNPQDERILTVPDTKRALIKVGGLYRSQFDIPFVGVTGSVGKTTTKELVHAVLTAKYRTLKNEGNRNNEIGVPETLFALDESHEAAVIEMGMSGFGELSDLTHAVRPELAIITCIGVSHLEALGSRENILRAKLEILEGMNEESPLILCGDDDLLDTVGNIRQKIYRYGIENPRNDIQAKDIVTQNGQTSFTILSPWGSFVAAIPTVGAHNVKNALAAFAAGCLLGVPPADGCAALMNYSPAGMRQRVVQHNGFTVVEDCYNCSPDSLRAAALALEQYPYAGRRLLVLSDMLELGPQEAELHAQCGAFLAKRNIDALYGCGKLTKYTLAAFGANARHFETKAALADFLKKELQAGDVAWLKASRGMKLEDVLALLYTE